ncbi:UNVERIFIED_CONTAM: hypothetical protein Sradi_3178800 [Sesamum radiatum]|uniref:Uncharacterized protein n=1 Tax=Sesamum radiatum TaxID=300843 RepID=A0AAW2RFG0_SESRA
MPRGCLPPPPPPPGGRGRGQVVRPPTPDVTDASEASTQPIVPPPAPPSIPTASQNPSVDSMQFTTSSAAAPPTAPPRARTYISGDDILAYTGGTVQIKSLQEYWGTDEFKKKSMQNKANRLANPAIANTVYRGGSSSMGEHKRKLEAQLGRPLKRMEVFASCYKKKNDCSWNGSRAEDVAETYQKMLEERASQLTPPEEGSSSAASVTPLEEEQLWTEAAGGRKRGRVFDMGSEALTSNASRPWIKDHRASTNSVASLPEPPISTQLQKIKLMLGILFDKIGIQMLRPDQTPATDAPAQESIQQQDEEDADP